MLVGRRMRTSLITVTKEATLARARELLHSHRIRHLPVVERERLLGILTDSDIRQASPSSAAGISPDRTAAFLAQIPVTEAMVRDVRTVSPYTTVEEAARLMIEHKIGCLPVTEADRLVGIITETDILGVLVDVMGIREPSTRFELTLPDRPGALAEVTRIIKMHEVNISSIVTMPHWEPEKRLAVIRLKTINPQPILKDLAAAGFEQPPLKP
ncbi:MAG: CBS domain-containing protein [candidate division NC10 bacterium]|nr:CBS domain-containing protein [candidate division NC10 bacterium]MBI4841476.1 CBS domain-containing protein [candidate division NC10 bacterium]